MNTRLAKHWLGFTLLLALLAGFDIRAVQAATDPQAAAQAAVKWLVGRQQADGSFPGFDAGASADAILALQATGTDPNTVQQNGVSPVAYLEKEASSYATKSTGAAGKVALAAITAGKDPRSFGGQNLIGLILKTYDSKTGRYGVQTTDHAYAMLALASAGQPIPQAAKDAVAALQLADGGWSFDGAVATGSDTNTTALVVQALVAAKASGATQTKALDYLKSQQNADGGFPFSQTSQFGTDSDANSTAAVVQAFTAAGVDVQTLAQNNNNPLTALASFQNPSGALRYQQAVPEDNDLATAQAIPALLLKPLPLATVSLPAVAASPALPATGADRQPVWLLVGAFVLLLAGVTLRARDAT